MERFSRFLFSRRSIVGSALAVGGLALHVLGLLGGPLWLPIVVGLYLVGILLVPGEPRLDLTLDAAADGEDVRKGLERLVRSLRGKVAPDILERVERIRDSILVTLEADQQRAAGDPDARLIRQTALDYLPTALTAYLALPRAQAERRPVAGGRTPHAVLLEQLDLMDTKMREAADAVLAHDSERLLASGRFLTDRFGVSSLRLDEVMPPAPGAVATPVPESVRVTPASVGAVPEAVRETADEREHVR